MQIWESLQSISYPAEKIANGSPIFVNKWQILLPTQLIKLEMGCQFSRINGEFANFEKFLGRKCCKIYCMNYCTYEFLCA